MLQDSNTIYQQKEHKLKYDDLQKFPKYIWFEYAIPFAINTLGIQWIQPSIEINNIEIVCFNLYIS